MVKNRPTERINYRSELLEFCSDRDQVKLRRQVLQETAYLMEHLPKTHFHFQICIFIKYNVQGPCLS